MLHLIKHLIAEQGYAWLIPRMIMVVASLIIMFFAIIKFTGSLADYLNQKDAEQKLASFNYAVVKTDKKIDEGNPYRESLRTYINSFEALYPDLKFEMKSDGEITIEATKKEDYVAFMFAVNGLKPIDKSVFYKADKICLNCSGKAAFASIRAYERTIEFK